MSDIIPVQHESAVAILHTRACELFREIEAQKRALEIATAKHDELLDLIATLSRKPRVRTARKPVEPANDQPANDQPEDTSSRPTVFASPSMAEEAAA
jgi:hypothetical protein